MSRPDDPTVGGYRRTVPKEYQDQIRLWHERAYAEEQTAGAVDRIFEHFGFTIVVPPQVMPITPMSHLLDGAVLAKAHVGERILDMGTGSGANAILAASRGADVLAVDVGPGHVGGSTSEYRAQRVG